jgi:hypothetical protein
MDSELLRLALFSAGAAPHKYSPNAVGTSPLPGTATAAAPPLSWHLTEVQKQAIEEEWRRQSKNSQWKKTYEFLKTKAFRPTVKN